MRSLVYEIQPGNLGDELSPRLTFLEFRISPEIGRLAESGTETLDRSLLNPEWLARPPGAQEFQDHSLFI